jgi:uncharacterized protein (TIGR03435 family)
MRVTTILTLLSVVLIGELQLGLRAQSGNTALASPRSAFDTVSAKRSSGADPRGTFQFQPGRFVMTNIPLRPLIQMAYKLPLTGNQNQGLIIGAPDWVDQITWDIEAKADGNPPREEVLLMIQTLLADRFKLALHQEIRQLPVYALVVRQPGKIGPQLVRHAADNSTCQRASNQPPAVTQPGARSARLPPPCGGDFRTGGGHIGVEATMETLAKSLSYFQQIDRAVLDRTGLAGTFDITLDYVPYTRNAQSASDANADDPALPSTIFTALQEQLGLKLESTKGPVDVLVIDHVEQPSAN